MMFKKNLWLLSIGACCAMISMGWAGCSNLAHSTTLTASHTIVNKTLSALSGLKSYNLDTDIKSYDNDSASLTDEWIGSKQVDIANQQLGMNMTIKDMEPGNILDLMSLGMYLEDGEDYQEDAAPGLSQPNPWSKTSLTPSLWNSETQIPYLTELLKTATQFNSSENETVDSIDCDVITITPSAQAAVDFVISQEQPFGPQIDHNYGGETPVVRPDAYKGGSIQLWIAQDTYLPVKVEIEIDFQGNSGGGPGSADSVFSPPTVDQENSSFQGELDFSDYNQPVSIQLPQGALNAQSVGN
jgi:hypothetical protein